MFSKTKEENSGFLFWQPSIHQWNCLKFAHDKVFPLLDVNWIAEAITERRRATLCSPAGRWNSDLEAKDADHQITIPSMVGVSNSSVMHIQQTALNIHLKSIWWIQLDVRWRKVLTQLILWQTQWTSMVTPMMSRWKSTNRWCYEQHVFHSMNQNLTVKTLTETGIQIIWGRCGSLQQQYFIKFVYTTLGLSRPQYRKTDTNQSPTLALRLQYPAYIVRKVKESGRF